MKSKKLLIISSIILVIMVATVTIYNLKYTKALPDSIGLKEITYKEIVKKKENEDNFILIVSRSNCSHCTSYKPKVEKVTKENRITVYYIDTDTLSNKDEFLNEFNLDGATPITLFFKNGKETILNRIEGDTSPKKIKDQFKKMGFID